ncbi:MAG TPA: class I SAM-dependent methyltransferase, partial [Lachnospiraceae bacterium]|nr:class I SAM-dependent methyltransferase [Lachnospiraceae bacterium]
MKSSGKRIEEKPSRTAAWTCTCRALSYLESEPQYKSEDYIAPELLPKFLLVLFKIKLFRKLFKNILIPSGMYEYVIARTKYFDFVFENVIANGFEQILIFGAGYDTRSIRFLSGGQNIKIYELDAPNTQNAKISQLKKRGITVHPNVVFVPIDFNRESLKDKLIEAGFEKGKKSLFMLEGLTMYLDQKAVDSTF